MKRTKKKLLLAAMTFVVVFTLATPVLAAPTKRTKPEDVVQQAPFLLNLIRPIGR